MKNKLSFTGLLLNAFGLFLTFGKLLEEDEFPFAVFFVDIVTPFHYSYLIISFSVIVFSWIMFFMAKKKSENRLLVIFNLILVIANSILLLFLIFLLLIIGGDSS